MTHTSRWGRTALLAGLALAAGPAAAPAQFVPGGGNPYARIGGPGMGLPGLGGVAGGALVTNPAAGLNPYLGAGGSLLASGYPNGPLGSYFANPYLFNQDPYGGYLRGAADVVNAQSNYLRAYQDAKLLREQARQAKVDTRRRVFDQWLYEREKTPSPEQMRQEFMKEQVKRSLNNPPRGEVNSGKSLNDLLAALETMPVKGASVPDLPLSEDILRHINVTRDGTGGGGNLGVLRNSGKLAWPRALADLPGTEDLRSNLAKRAEVAYEQAVSGRADPTVLEKMAAASRELNDRLTAVVRETDFGDYSEAKRFLRNLDDAIQSLRNPEAGRLLTGADGASGKSVKDLVSNMLGGGYRFAPAVSGGESAYQALHSKLVNFYNSLQTASNTPTP